MSEDIRVTTEHTRKLNYCAFGLRAFYRKHGLDFKQFLEEGTPVANLEATGDAMAIRAVEVARGLR